MLGCRGVSGHSLDCATTWHGKTLWGTGCLKTANEEEKNSTKYLFISSVRLCKVCQGGLTYLDDFDQLLRHPQMKCNLTLQSETGTLFL